MKLASLPGEGVARLATSTGRLSSWPSDFTPRSTPPSSKFSTVTSCARMPGVRPTRVRVVSLM